MGKTRNENESLRNLSPELADPLRRLQAELSRLKKTPPGGSRNQDADVTRLLEALRQVGEALLPLAGSEEPAPPAQPGPVLAFRRTLGSEGDENAQPQRPVVFLVEPEPSLNEYIQRVLGAEGFVAVSLANLEASVERASVEAPDVVVVDQLVLGSGEQEKWLVRLKTEPALARAPIVLIRSLEDDDTFHPFGIAATVTKPIETQELLDALRRLTTPATDPPDASEVDEGSVGGGRRVVRG